MEPTASGALGNPPMPAASTTASAPPATAPGMTAGSARALLDGPLRQLSSMQMPKVIKDRADDLEKRIGATDIARINGYMRLVNLVCAALLAVTCFIRMFQSPSYSHFLVIIYIM